MHDDVLDKAVPAGSPSPQDALAEACISEVGRYFLHKFQAQQRGRSSLTSPVKALLHHWGLPPALHQLCRNVFLRGAFLLWFCFGLNSLWGRSLPPVVWAKYSCRLSNPAYKERNVLNSFRIGCESFPIHEQTRRSKTSLQNPTAYIEAKCFCDLKPIFMALNGLMGDYLIGSGDGGCTRYLTGDFIFSFFRMQTLATQELEASLAFKEIPCS